jgi:hypothetical protein
MAPVAGRKGSSNSNVYVITFFFFFFSIAMSIANTTELDLDVRSTPAFKAFPWYTDIILTTGSLRDLVCEAISNNSLILEDEAGALKVRSYPVGLLTLFHNLSETGSKPRWIPQQSHPLVEGGKGLYCGLPTMRRGRSPQSSPPRPQRIFGHRDRSPHNPLSQLSRPAFGCFWDTRSQ